MTSVSMMIFIWINENILMPGKSPDVGRFMVAKRDVKAEEEVFRDIPAVIGPDNSAVPMCTVCWRSEMRCLIYTG